jgi:Zn-dependent protease with chaperone function
VSLLLLTTGIGMVLLPGMTRRIGRHMVPSMWTWMCLLSLVVGAATIEVASLLYAAPTALRAVGIPGLADLCQQMLDALVPGGRVFGWLGAALAVAVAVGAGIGTIHARRERAIVRASSELGVRVAGQSPDLVVLPTDATIALSISGAPDQVIVSKGLVQLLSAEELSVVLAHEAAHLEHRHERFASIACAIEHGLWFLPFIHRSTATLRFGTERWADESAAIQVPGGRQLLESALVKVSSSSVGPTILAFSGSESVLERIWALRNPSRSTALALGLALTPGFLLGSIGLAGTVATSASAWSLISDLGHCPL